MKMIEKELLEYTHEVIFTWDDIEAEPEQEKLGNFLKENYGIDWIDNATFIRKKNTLLIKDNRKETIILSKGTYDDKTLNTIEIKLENSKARLVLNGNPIREFRVVTDDSGKIKIQMLEKEILTIWFNAWRYEREEQFALIALIKTIAYAMVEFPVYHDVKKIFLRGLGLVTKDVVRQLLLKYVVTEKGLEELERKLLPKMELLSEVEKNTVYFDGLSKIEEEMKKLSKKHRIVVFIDDLDRCNSKKALEVFESTKIFLDLQGFVFVIGLNYDTLSKLIKEEHKQIGIRGEEYIRKLVQIPVNLPRWNSDDIYSLIEKISSKLGNYLLDKNDESAKELLTIAVASNPRETKRLLNHLMLIKSINPSIEIYEFLVNHILESHWTELYQNLDLDKGFRSVFIKVLELNYKDIYTLLDDYKKNKSETEFESHEKKLFEIPLDIWLTIWKYKILFLKIIKQWELQKEIFSLVSVPIEMDPIFSVVGRKIMLLVDEIGSDLKSETFTKFKMKSNDILKEAEAEVEDAEAKQRIILFKEELEREIHKVDSEDGFKRLLEYTKNRFLTRRGQDRKVKG